MPSDARQRRVLRLGALLFRLKYYMQTANDIAAHIYRLTPDTYVQVVGDAARLVHGDLEEVVSLEEAIARCKDALAGGSLHGAVGD